VRRTGGIGRPAGVPLRGLAGPVTSVAISRDGQFVAAGAETIPAGTPSGGVQAWSTVTLRPVAITISDSTGASVAFTPDGKYLATAATGGTVELFSLAAATGKSPAASEQYGFVTAAPVALAFSPDGATMATVSADGRIRLWQTPTAALPNGRQVGQSLDSAAGPATSIAFSPDGNTLAAGTAAGTVVLWDVATGQPIASPLSGQRGPVTSVAFSPAGTLLGNSDGDGTARLWNVGYASGAATLVCAATGRALTSAEWQQYAPAGLGYESACPAPGSAPGTRSPTLGRAFGLFQHGGQGFGHVKPPEIFNGGDPTGLVTHIAWASWGAPQATGSGMAYYVGPGKTVDTQATAVTATVVAFDLGPCDGRVMYRAVEWYFPSLGGSFDPSSFEDVCDGAYVGPGFAFS
jgi:dipeptidyl aminopeptidase/acylaminoacyl peptidase